MKWAIIYVKAQCYFVGWTALGPRFGGATEDAKKFRTKKEAETAIAKFPSFMSTLVSPTKLPKRGLIKARRK